MKFWRVSTCLVLTLIYLWTSISKELYKHFVTNEIERKSILLSKNGNPFDCCTAPSHLWSTVYSVFYSVWGKKPMGEFSRIWIKTWWHFHKWRVRIGCHTSCKILFFSSYVTREHPSMAYYKNARHFWVSTGKRPQAYCILVQTS